MPTHFVFDPTFDVPGIVRQTPTQAEFGLSKSSIVICENVADKSCRGFYDNEPKVGPRGGGGRFRAAAKAARKARKKHRHRKG